MLTLNKRLVVLPNGKNIYRNVTTKNHIQWWIRYRNDRYQVRQRVEGVGKRPALHQM